VAFGQPANGQQSADDGTARPLYSSPAFAQAFLAGSAVSPLSVGTLSWLVPKNPSSTTDRVWILLALAVAVAGLIPQVISRRDALKHARQGGRPAAAPFYYFKLLTPRGLKAASAQAGWPVLWGPVVVYGFDLFAIPGLIRLEVLAHTGGSPPTIHVEIHYTVAEVIFKTSGTVAIFGLLFAGLFQLRRTAIRRHWGHRTRPLDLQARGWGPVARWQANRDNMIATQRSWLEWDVRHDFSRRARNGCLWLVGASASVAIVAAIVHAVSPSA